MRNEATDAASRSAVRTTFAGVDHARLDEVLKFAGSGIEAPAVILAIELRADDPRAVQAGIIDDQARRARDARRMMSTPDYCSSFALERLP